MRSDYEIPVCTNCYGIICNCEEAHPRRFMTVRKWARVNGVSMETLEEAEQVAEQIKASLIELDPAYEKEFGDDSYGEASTGVGESVGNPRRRTRKAKS